MIEPDVERELTAIRALFTREMQCYRELTELQDKTRMEALRVALAANEKRLDAMNEIRQALSDQGGQMVTRKESESSIDVVAVRVEQIRASLESRMETMTRPNWTLIFSAISVCLVMITGVWVLIGLKVDASVAPVGLLAEQVKVQGNLDADRLRLLENRTAGSTEADAASRIDRVQLNDRLRSLENNLASSSAERRSQYAVMQSKLVEIETQFCASDIVRNLMHAQDMRTDALLWAKTNPGETMPTDNSFYPMICNRSSNGNDQQ